LWGVPKKGATIGEHVLYLSVVWHTHGAEDDRSGHRPDENPVEVQRSRVQFMQYDIGSIMRYR
jgi:hypothetical protein